MRVVRTNIHEEILCDLLYRKSDIFIVIRDIFLFQGLQLQITRYLLTMKAKVTHLISMLDTSRYFWIRMTWRLTTQPWASRLVTCVEITSNVCSIFTPLEKSALEWRLRKRWNLLLQLSMKRRRQVKKDKDPKNAEHGSRPAISYHYMVCYFKIARDFKVEEKNFYIRPHVLL